MIYFNDQIVFEAYYNGSKISYSLKVDFPEVYSIERFLKADFDGGSFAEASRTNRYSLKGYNGSYVSVNGINVGASTTTIQSTTSGSITTSYTASISDGVLQLTTSKKIYTKLTPVTISALGLNATLARP